MVINVCRSSCKVSHFDFNKNLNVLSSSRKRNALSVFTQICLVEGALFHTEICNDMMKQTFL